MKFLKILLIIILLVVAGLLIFLPTELKFDRSIVIDAPPSVVYSEVANYENWLDWSPWHKQDTAIQVKYGSAKMGEGAEQSWKSENPNVGTGRMVTTEAIENEKIVQNIYLMESEDPFEAYFKFEETEDGKTKVIWGQNAEASTFALADRLVFGALGGIIKDQYREGLENLKNEAEYQFANAKPYELDIMEKEIPKELVLVVKDSCSTNQPDISAAMQNCYSDIMMHIKKNKIKTSGTAYAVAHIWDEENKKYVFEAGFDVNDKNVAKTDKMKVIELGGQNYVVAMLKGGYQYLMEAHLACDKYVKENKLELAGAPFEKYINDPSKQETSDMLTMVAYPVK